MKKILFISPNKFPRETGGAVLFRRLINSFKFCEFTWVSLENSKKVGLTINNQISVGYSFFSFFFFLDRLLRKIPFFGKSWFKFRNFYFRFLGSKFNISSLDNFDLIWIYASSWAIPFASSAFKFQSVKFHISVQDDIYGHLPKWEADLLLDDYIWLLKNANSIDFASNSLKEYSFIKYNFINKFEIICFADQIPLDFPVINPSVTNIGFAGNVWCQDNFNTLLFNIKELNFKGYNLKLNVFSNNFPKNLLNLFSNEIVYRGVLDNISLLNALQEMDLLYVPMSFDINKRILSSTSFPSKVFTYLNVGVPILFHSPFYSSTYEFYKKHEVGFFISSNSFKEFCFEFEKVINSKVEKRKIFSKKAILILNNFYSFPIQKSKFINLIWN